MKVAELLERRQQNWRELELLCGAMQSRTKASMGAAAVTRFAALYRAACADLALADAYQLPPHTVLYLHQLVGRSHNQLYRSRGFTFGKWLREIAYNVPQRMLRDRCLWVAFFLFWGLFVASAGMAYTSRSFAEKAIDKQTMAHMEDSFSGEIVRGLSQDTEMFGFYVWHNTTIGLRCFICGAALFGVGGLFETAFNAYVLGASFGYMATTPQSANFFHFVTAHGPFELTAIVLAAGTGLRCGFALVWTKGLQRLDSWKKAAQESLPMAAFSAVLFMAAATIEGFISATALPYAVKAGVAIFSIVVLLVYFLVLGFPREKLDAIR
ncbi:MAG: stage II sporulation protein M [Pirellulales bacterium]